MTKNDDWRNEVSTRTCRSCGCDFEGKYNSHKCNDCKKAVRREIQRRFEENNPNYFREWMANNPRRKDTRLRHSYGITEEEWDSLHAEQSGKCAICGAEGGWKANGGALVVDHDHSTGKVRGLLCPSCNRGLGQFEDDPERLRSAARYVDREIQRISAAEETGSPWTDVGYAEADEGRLYTADLRPYLDKLKDSAKGGLVGEQGPELMPLNARYSAPIDEVEEFDNSGLEEYVRKLAKAATEQEDERLNKALAKALWEYPRRAIRIVQWAGDARSRIVEVFDGDEWRVFEG